MQAWDLRQVLAVTHAGRVYKRKREVSSATVLCTFPGESAAKPGLPRALSEGKRSEDSSLVVLTT